MIIINTNNFQHSIYYTSYQCNNIVGNLMIGILFHFPETQNIDLF